MRIITQTFVLFIALLVFGSPNLVFAGEGIPIKAVFVGSDGQMVVNEEKTVTDLLYASSVTGSYKAKNRITLKINSATPWFLQTAFSAKVRMRITSSTTAGTTSIDTSLSVNYLTDSTYVNESCYAFSGAYSVTVKILEVVTDAGWDVWKALLLENELQGSPVFNLDCVSNAIQSVAVESLAADTDKDELSVSWGNVLPADEYDLEWTYIDKSALDSGRYGSPSSPTASLIFDNNCSRVSITGTSYKIPLLYDNYGTLFIRVRPVQNQPGGGRSAANWSSDYTAGLGKFVFNGHERPLNWQATTSFAEDGKRKSVVQYYDGSLRSRQTVTKDNSTGTTIVGESFYDYQGRPVIQVMPAPTLSNLIKYSRNFNVALASDSAYDKDDFDLLPDSAFYCNTGASPMKPTSGAAQYYSPQNPDNNIGINRFIPDAAGYPFTEVQYTQDNTGRISRQSGVGETHKLGNDHETKYYYGSPDQEELDALFGTEVGDRLHYSKNMVRDANGQYSISYVDMHGRTIATALAGIPATKMDPDGVTSYQWSKLSGGVATITSPTSATTTVTGLEKGVYVFRLIVKDQLGAFQFNDVTITVTSTPGSPDASAGADQSITLPVSSVSLTGTATDEGGTITGYTWSKVSGGAATITSATSASTTVTGLVQGTYVFRLTVTDNTGAIATSEVTVYVYPAPSSVEVSSFNFTLDPVSVSGWNNLHGNPAFGVISATDPVTSVSVNSVNNPNWAPYFNGYCAFDGGGETGGTFFPSGVMANYWFQYNGLNASYNAAKPQLEITGLTPGTPYTIRVSGSVGNTFSSITRYSLKGDKIILPTEVATRDNTATGAVFSDVLPDASGKIKVYVNTSSSNTEEVSIISGLQVLKNSSALSVITETDLTIKLPTTTANLKGIARDPQGTIASYLWTKVSGGAATIVSPSSAATSIEDLEAGDYIFRLTVTSSTGAIAASQVDLTVYPEAVTKYVVGVNFTSSPVAIPGWLNLNGNPNTAIREVTDASTGIKISSIATANWTPYFGSNTANDGAGMDNTTFFPTAVMKNMWFQFGQNDEVAFDINRPQLRISGLTPGTPYTLKMSSSYNLGSFFNGVTRYTVAGEKLETPVVIDTKNNISMGAVFTDIIPDHNGIIQIYVNTNAPVSNNTATISGLQIVIDNMPPTVDAGGDQTITLPVNMVTLSGSGMDPETGNVTTVTRRLLDSSNNIVSGRTIKAVKSLLVPVAGIHSFIYDLNPQSLQLAGCDSSQVCYDCLYDLRITITDDCNNQKLGGHAFDTLFRNFQIGALDTICGTTGFHVTFNKYLQEGNYEITKTLTLSQYAQDYYRDSIFINNNTCRTLETFIEEQRQLLRANADCIPSCQKCLDSLGTWDTYRIRYMTNARIAIEDTAKYREMARAAYDQEAADCKLLCGTVTESGDTHNAMLSDMTPPSGQYATLVNDSAQVEDKYSIFYTDLEQSALPDTVAYYKRAVYYDENGRLDSVYDETSGKMVTPGMLTPAVFAEKFKSSWANALLQYHPENCKLEKIELETMKASYAWDIKFAGIETYREAMDSGYLNPTNITTSPYNRFTQYAAGHDPLSGVAPYGDSLNTHLLRYRKNSINGTGASLWGLATALTMCGDIDAPGSCFNNWAKIDSSFNESRMCTGDLDMAWRNFRQLYLTIKKEKITQIINLTCTSPSSATLMAAGHQPNFGNAQEYLQSNPATNYLDANNPTVAKQKTAEGLAAFYEDNCKAYAVQWWLRLKPCAYSSADSANIINAFIQVCKEGSDENHVMGSSTIKPTSTYRFKSFEEVMKYYSSSTYNANCNTYLVDFPKPYDQQRAYSDVEVWRKPDSCQCSVINGWYAKYQASTFGDTTFSAYLQRVANTFMTNGALDSLRQLCNGQITCEYIPAPIALAPALQCGIKDVCLNCNTIKEYYNQYKVEFPGCLPSKNESNPTLQERNQKFVQFMNYKTGFVKTAFDYLDFMNTCGFAGNSFSCDSLYTLISDYKDSIRNTRHLDAGGCDTTHWRINYGGSERGVGSSGTYDAPVPLNQIFRNGVAWHPKSDWAPNAQHVDHDYYGCMETNNQPLTFEFRIKIPEIENTPVPLTEYLYFLIFWQKNDDSTYRNLFSFKPQDSIFGFCDNRNCADYSAPIPQNFNDWKVARMEYYKDSVRVKFDGVTILNKLVGYNRQRLTSFSFSTFANNTYIDYIKIYDSTNNLLYNEEFDGCESLATPNFPDCMGSTCKSRFTEYFNRNNNTTYTYDQIDSIYYSTCGSFANVCDDRVAIDNNQLKSTLKSYQNEFIQPSSGTVDLDMRTFAGNKTPAEGPKGVFNVNGTLIGNTIDSTSQQVNASFASIWNSDPSNNVVGHLSALENGKFRLTLNSGQAAPCNGIIGMRYYRFEALVKDTMRAIGTAIGSYVDFGDSSAVLVKDAGSYNGGKTVVWYPTDEFTPEGKPIMAGFFENKWALSEDYISITRFEISHIYTHSSAKVPHTITVYHTDYKGLVWFDDTEPFNNSSQFADLHGYFPQNLLEMHFSGTNDTSINSTRRIKNFHSINSIQDCIFGSATARNGSVNYFRHNNFESFAQNKSLKRLRLEGAYEYQSNYSISDSLRIDSLAGRKFSENFPDFNINFKDLRCFIVYKCVTRESDLFNFNFSLPKLKVAFINWQYNPSGFIDTFYNQLASVNLVDSGIVGYGYPVSPSRTSASDAAVSQLVNRGWSMSGGYRGVSDFLCNDTLPYTNAFTEYFNEKNGTNYSLRQLDSIYLSTLGRHLDVCKANVVIDSAQLKSVLQQYQNTQINPSSGFVDLDMRTFAGNKTPEEGPKGVFNVNGVLIGNTVDSTSALVNASFAGIWNSDSANQMIGHLSALENGKFRLALNAGQTAPCDGIIGMRFYQFEAITRDTLKTIGTSIGSYVHFGDGKSVLVKDIGYYDNDSTRIIYNISNTFGPNGKPYNAQFFEKKWVMSEDYIPVTRYGVVHIYPHTSQRVSRTVTIYHTDYKGIVHFIDNTPRYTSTMFANLRGYFPQNLLEMYFAGTRDTTINTTKRIRNFNSISSIQNIHFVYSGGTDGSTNYFQHNNFESFENNKGLKRLRLEGPDDYKESFTLSDSLRIDSIAGRKFSENFPNFNVNFPDMRCLITYSWATRQSDIQNFNFSLPKLKIALFYFSHHPSSFKDSLYNQLARVSMTDSGQVGYDGEAPTAASSSARATLLARNWLIGTYGPDGPDDILTNDTLPYTNAFAEYLNQHMGTNYNLTQIDSLYTAYNVPLNLCPAFCDTCYNSLNGPLLCGKSEPAFPRLRILPTNNCSDSTFFAVGTGTAYYNVYTDSLKNHFDSSYTAKCLQAYKLESFTVKRPNSEYHYTLYYYDQAGNLVKTVPPAGVDESKFRWSNAWSDSVSAARTNRTLLTPDHLMETKYWYNTLNQVEMQHTPDAGQSSFWYDRLGRLVVSQNQRQQFVSVPEQNRLYSYTEYDYLGRIREVGEIKNATSTKMSHALSRSPGSLQSWMTASVAGKSQITSTTYDLAYGGFTPIQPIGQKNLRNRVSYTSYTDGSNPVQYNQASFYSYDIHGNVDTLVQDYGNSTFSAVQNVMNMNNNRFKKLVYRYDLISGKVNEVAYQPGELDQFYHRYQYDAENRLTNVETSYDNTLWQKDARYEYYKHGPLARTLLGDQLVQGMDYAYTLQGWLKGMNSTALTPVQDMSGDGVTGGLNVNIARDVVGYNLNYYQGDYQAIGTSVAPFAPVNGSVLQGSYRPLYNGNISSMSVNISKFDGPVLYNYKYDRLNRLTQMDTWKGFNANGNNWSGITLTEDYKERIAYDPNGNILKYLRNTANNPSPMDSLNYKYYPGKNQLSRIRDNANPAIEGLKDIEDQPVDNYVYDLIGNLTADKSENITSIDWNVYGKITSILRSGVSGSNTAKRINYSYDAAGNRISKRVVKFGSAEVEYTWYVRDASGNVMGVYSAKKDTTGSSALPGFDVTLTEQHLYGSSRMGIQRRSENVEGALSIANVYKHVTGLRYYELSNHLGNVLATISDKKVGVASLANSSLIDHYDADVVSAQDYYPFGMLMPGRSYSGSSYRYGFNGKEKSDEVEGEGNIYDYGFRIYNPRIGKFLSVDPLTNSYPYYTPYQFAGNMPIAAIDLDGLEQHVVIYHKDQNNATTNIEIRAIYDNNGAVLNQHLHKVGGTKDIAKGNVLVFESYRLKNGNENLKIVENRNISKSSLTAEESKIFSKYKKAEKESGETQSLSYGGNSKTSLYESQDFENKDTKTFDANLGLAQQPQKTIDRENIINKANEPSAPDVPPVILGGTGWNYTDKYDQKIRDIANWLIKNPSFNLEIESGGIGGHTDNPNSWDDKISGTTIFGYGGSTYKERIISLFDQYKKDILRVGKGKIGSSRLSFKLGKVNSNSVKATVKKQP